MILVRENVMIGGSLLRKSDDRWQMFNDAIEKLLQLVQLYTISTSWKFEKYWFIRSDHTESKKKMLNIWYYIAEIAYTSKNTRHEVTRSYSDKKHVGKWIGASFFSETNSYLHSWCQLCRLRIQLTPRLKGSNVVVFFIPNSRVAWPVPSGQSAPKEKEDTQHSP